MGKFHSNPSSPTRLRLQLTRGVSAQLDPYKFQNQICDFWTGFLKITLDLSSPFVSDASEAWRGIEWCVKRTPPSSCTGPEGVVELPRIVTKIEGEAIRFFMPMSRTMNVGRTTRIDWSRPAFKAPFRNDPWPTEGRLQWTLKSQATFSFSFIIGFYSIFFRFELDH